MTSKKSSVAVFLDIPESQQKVLAIQVLSGLEWTDGFLLQKTDISPFNGSATVMHSNFRKIYSYLESQHLCIPRIKTLTDAAYYQIALTVADPSYLYHKTVIAHVQRSFVDFAAMPYDACIKQSIFLNKAETFVYDPRYSPVSYTNDIKIIQSFLYDFALDLEWLQTREPLIRAFICCARLLFLLVDEPQPTVDFKKVLKVYRELALETLQHDYLYHLMIQIDVALGDLQAATDNLNKITDKNFLPALSACPEHRRGEHRESNGIKNP